MWKYASHVSAKTIIGLEVGNAQKILDRSDLSDKDKEVVIDIIKNMAYHWCRSEAVSSTAGEVVRELLGEEAHEKLRVAVMCSDKVAEKTSDMYPF